MLLSRGLMTYVYPLLLCIVLPNASDTAAYLRKKNLYVMSSKEDSGGKESKEPDYDDDGADKNQLEEKQEAETGEIKEEKTKNLVF